MRFSFIHAEKAHHSIRSLCRNLEVSPSGYYAWARRSPSNRDKEDEVLSTHLRAIHKASRGTYGSPRLHRALRRQGITPSRKRVVRLMRQAGLRGLTPKRWRTTTDSDHGMTVAPNRLERDFTASRPDEVWVADITYVRTRDGSTWPWSSTSTRVAWWAGRPRTTCELSW